LEHPVAVLTGGTGGLGRQVAIRLARRGFCIASTYLVPDEAEEVEKLLELPEERLMLQRVDCTDPEAVTALMNRVADAFGPINVLASLIGRWAGGRDVADTDDGRFERMLDVNLRTAFYAARAVIPHMRKAEWGRIIFVGSRAAVETPAGQAAYNVAKAGVVALANSIAQETGDEGITANSVMPSYLDTPAFRSALPYADYVHWPTPDEIAAVIDFLASKDSGVINGAALPVYGNV